MILYYQTVAVERNTTKNKRDTNCYLQKEETSMNMIRSDKKITKKENISASIFALSRSSFSAVIPEHANYIFSYQCCKIISVINTS